MSSQNVSGKHLKRWGLPHGRAFSVAIGLFKELGISKQDAEVVVRGISQSPEKYLEGPYKTIAQVLVKDKKEPKIHRLRSTIVPTKVFGEDMIEPGALAQIYQAAKLPVSVQAALMPDAHLGYGLPIGGVLATDNAIIPYAVGVDIGCRMHLTITDVEEKQIRGQDERLANILRENTVFGPGIPINVSVEHPILDDERFQSIPCVKKDRLRDKAIQQIGTSGGGNHFVEFGIVNCGGGVEKLAILSHSGSRAVGFKIANLYTRLAIDKCKLEKAASRLAWLSLDDEDGQEYWEAMNLAGDFARACHETIHHRILKALKVGAEEVIQNHHNFAWKECLPDGRDVIIHRKGATPARSGELGIIPGSMSTPTYIVSGKGNPDSMCSSSHGAGRRMSRRAAKETFSMSQFRTDLENKGVTLIGGSLDEFTGAYKDIDEVMYRQSDLVTVMGTFSPWIVKMSESEPERRKKK